MALTDVRLRVSSIYPESEPESTPRPPRAGDGLLTAAKAALLCLGAVVLLASRLGPAMPRIVRNESRGVSMRCPRGWRGHEGLPHGVAAFFRGGPRSVVTLWRLSWTDLVEASLSFDWWVPEPCRTTDLEGCLADVSRWVGFAEQGRWTLVEDTALGGRPALMLVAPCHSIEQPWGAVAVAPGEDLLFLELRTSSQAQLKAVWREWKAMIRSVRVTGPLGIAP